RLSVGTLHNIVDQAVAAARPINERQDLSRVRIGADDEIFQASRPVLVGIDTESTYCYLLSQEEHRDGDTWGVRLLELVDRGFAPEATVADFGSGLRAGHEQALPGVACRGDVFHSLRNPPWLAHQLLNLGKVPKDTEFINCRIWSFWHTIWSVIWAAWER